MVAAPHSRILDSVRSLHAFIFMSYSISAGRLQKSVCVSGRGVPICGSSGEFLLTWFQCLSVGTGKVMFTVIP